MDDYVDYCNRERFSLKLEKPGPHKGEQIKCRLKTL